MGSEPADARPRRLRNFLRDGFLVAATVWTLGASGQAYANTACSVSGGTLTCSADQSAGVSSINSASELDLDALTAPIAPLSGTRGVDFEFTAVNGTNPGDDGVSAPDLTFNADSTTAITSQNANGIFVLSQGGNAIEDLNLADIATPKSANGGAGGDVSLTSAAMVTVTGNGQAGVLARSIGGNAAAVLDGSGNTGGAGGLITITNTGAVTTTGIGSPDLMGESLGGEGGGAASSTGAPSQPFGGAGGAVTITNSATLIANADQSAGIYAHSLGGSGGIFSLAGVPGGLGGAVTVNNSGAITTFGASAGSSFASAIYALSQGGDGNSGGSDSSLFSGSGGDGGHGALAGTVTVSDSGVLTTSGGAAEGIRALSLGGVAGAGGDAAAASATGGAGGYGGFGNTVTVTASGNITASGAGSVGIFALSEGNTGGAGGTANGFIDAIGGSGGAGGNGGEVDVTLASGTTITSDGAGISAESRGGTGGVGGEAGAFVGIASGGGAGGDGGVVNVTVNGGIVTTGNLAYGVLAQSIGGGGGYGGTSLGVVAAGGTGGGGSKGGAVTVTNNGSISTSGASAYGVFAQSIGGGGGIGSVSGALVSFGGNGQASPAGCQNGANSSDRTLCNDGGAITITNAGTIATSGQFSAGIVATSIGGGGGDGGEAVGAFSFGGSGGEGGNGGLVTLTNTDTGSIVTTGADARGILALSIGGGGGDGGNSVAVGVSSQVAVGGSGGNGGNGGDLEIENDGKISTLGVNSNAIDVASIGGGGGDAGDAVAEGFSAFTLSIGGSGGGGGNGGAVTLVNSGALNIESSNSDAIFTQSVGGGGGNGGAGTSFGASPVFNLSISVGGSGGQGGSGGAVSTTNSGSIFTAGEDDIAIFAQSVGGGGGVGGSASATGLSLSAEDIPSVALSFAVGGSGGGGGSGSTVGVTNSGAIATLGDGAFGIEAQSVGGGGGNGGDSTATPVAISFGGSSLSLAVAVGGSGGIAGNGGTVTVANSATISTQGYRAYGIFAQSVGGGGGSGGAGGGSADSVNNQADVPFANDIAKARGAAESAEEDTKGKQLELSLTIGGSGGAAGNGGDVNVTNAGAIVTEGYGAYGVLAQSVGGGGGVGGAGIGDSGGLIPFTADTFSAAVVLGGNGGASGTGGDVAVTNSGTITTYGGDAAGIFGQSIGGGGGIADTGDDQDGQMIAAGSGGAASGDAGLTALNANVGGTGSASGNGGTVAIAQTGNITTFGDTAFGIEAQSVGGGGGFGGDATDGYTDKLAVGGAAGAAGNGGDITVNMNGNIVTTGNGADGIMAQSVGGGGGIAGNITGNAKAVDASTLLSTLTPVPYAVLYATGNAPSSNQTLFTIPSFVGLLTVTQNGGAGGTGGVVNVTDSGNITTSGAGADGIFAQSIGGGGGVSGTSTNAVLEFEGSIGNSGSGGEVTVDHTGSITTSGTDASAIFAQSVGGSVSVNAATRLATFGQAFLLENAGSFGTGDDINVAVAGGTFGGGSNSGAGIWIDNGLDNTITIASSATVEALSGVAIKATANSGVVVNSVDNSGTVLGDVQLAGVSANSFINEAGAILAPNTAVNLAGGTLTNKGTLSPGGSGVAATVTITGNLVETASSTYAADVGYGVGPSDLIAVIGNASMVGTVSPHFTAIANQPVTLLTTTGTLTNSGTSVTGDTAVLTYSLSFSPNALVLDTAADWTPPAATLNPNESSLGDYLQSLWNSGSTGFAGGMGQLASIVSPSAYAGALNQLTGEIGGDASQAAAQAFAPFLDLLTQTGSLDSGDDTATSMNMPADVKPAQLQVGAIRVWASAFGGHSSFGADATSGAQRLSAESVGAAAGIESQINDDLLIGGSLGGGSESFSLAGGQSQGMSTDVMLGAYARQALLGHGYLSGVVAYAWHNVGTERVISISGVDVLDGHFVAGDFGGRVEGGYSFGLEDGSALTPYLGFAGQDFSAPAYGEHAVSGASTFALSYAPEDSGLVHSELGLRLGHDFDMADDTLSTEFHAAWAHQIQDDATSQATFQTLAGSSFVVTGALLPQDSAILGAGLQIKSQTGISGRARIESQFGPGFSAVSGTVSIGYSW